VAVSKERLWKLLDRFGIKMPTDQDVMIAALVISIEDWKRELKASIHRQRRNDDEEDE